MFVTWIFRHFILSAVSALLLLGYVGVIDLGGATSSIVREAQTYVAGDVPLDPRGATEGMLQRKHQTLMEAAEDRGAPVEMQGYHGALKQAVGQ